jgi:hypothetical protein
VSGNCLYVIVILPASAYDSNIGPSHCEKLIQAGHWKSAYITTLCLPVPYVGDGIVFWRSGEYLSLEIVDLTVGDVPDVHESVPIVHDVRARIEMRIRRLRISQ